MEGSKVCLLGNNFASFNVLLPFDVLHFEHAVMTFSQLVFPPRDLATIWSNVKLSLLWQYWHLNPSLKKTLKRVNAGFLEQTINCFNEITLGILNDIDGDLTISLYSETTLTFSKKLLLYYLSNHRLIKGSSLMVYSLHLKLMF